MKAEPDSEATATATATGDRPPSATPPVSDAPVARSGALAARDRARYELLEERGRGGLGRVFRGHDRELGRDVAVKELLQRGRAAELRFFREALVTARLEHPGIVPVHEAGRWADGTPFYAMKLVGGRSLRALIDEGAALEARLPLIGNVIAVADAMAYAHDQRIIHRDLKPSNVMVGDFGETIVIDWGLAKALDDDSPDDEAFPYRSPARTELTMAGSSLGTPAYMAPEQFGGRVDHRADVYALGGMLYHVLAGRPPHDRADSRTAAPPPLPRGVPEDLAAVVRRAMARDAGDRYASAAAFAEDLRRYQRRDQVSARRYSLGARLGLAFARHRRVAVVAMFALVALSATLAVSALRIARGRAEAVAAREAAQVSNARALLERDPTRAWDALSGVPATPEVTLLRARIRAAGVADRTIQLPARFEQGTTTPDGESLLLSTSDRVLSLLDLKTGALTTLAEGLTSPGQWVVDGRRVFFVHTRPRLAIASVPTSGGPISDIAALRHLPDDLDASDGRVVWLARGSMFAATTSSAAVELARGVLYFALGKDKLSLCHQNGVLALDPAGGDEAHCAPNGRMIGGTTGLAYADPSGRVTVVAAGSSRVIDTQEGRALRIQYLTATGVLVALDGDNNVLFLRPESTAFERMRLSAQYAALEARDDLVAIAYGDGSFEVFDTRTREQWRIQAHSDPVYSIILLPRRRAISFTRTEARLWTFSPSGITLLGTLGASSNSIAPGPGGDLLFDGIDGGVRLIRAGTRDVVTVHRHDRVSYGVAWCDRRACSSGWDGSVRCTELVDGTTSVAKFEGSATWISGATGRCFALSSSGGIYDAHDLNQPAYRQDHEPSRLAVAGGGAMVVSGDWGGYVETFDVRRGRVIAARRLHERQIVAVAWSGDKVATGGADGRLVVSTLELLPLRVWNLGAAVRDMAVVGDVAGVGLEDGTLLLMSANDGILQRVKTGSTFNSLAMAPDGEAVAVGTATGNLLILTAAGRVGAVRFVDGRVRCLYFESRDVVVACAPSDKVVRVALDSVTFE